MCNLFHLSYSGSMQDMRQRMWPTQSAVADPTLALRLVRPSSSNPADRPRSLSHESHSIHQLHQQSRGTEIKLKRLRNLHRTPGARIATEPHLETLVQRRDSRWWAVVLGQGSRPGEGSRLQRQGSRCQAEGGRHRACPAGEGSQRGEAAGEGSHRLEEGRPRQVEGSPEGRGRVTSARTHGENVH